jgi:hypothetical protein
MTTAAEKRYMGRVAELGCCICSSQAQVHHIREGVGMGQRSSPYLTIPLCEDHHTGSLSIHKAKRQFEQLYGDELKLLAMTIERLNP